MILHTCRYCERFQSSHIRHVGNKRVDHQKRYCTIKEDYVEADDTPCKEFIPHNYFWCETGQQWIAILACLNRQRLEAPMCMEQCTQYEIIDDVIRGQDLKRLGPTKRLHLFEKKAPKLKLRKKRNVNPNRHKKST